MQGDGRNHAHQPARSGRRKGRTGPPPTSSGRLRRRAYARYLGGHDDSHTHVRTDHLPLVELQTLGLGLEALPPERTRTRIVSVPAATVAAHGQHELRAVGQQRSQQFPQGRPRHREPEHEAAGVRVDALGRTDQSARDRLEGRPRGGPKLSRHPGGYKRQPGNTEVHQFGYDPINKIENWNDLPRGATPLPSVATHGSLHQL